VGMAALAPTGGLQALLAIASKGALQAPCASWTYKKQAWGMTKDHVHAAGWTANYIPPSRTVHIVSSGICTCLGLVQGCAGRWGFRVLSDSLKPKRLGL
jgi:hypothetical protein